MKRTRKVLVIGLIVTLLMTSIGIMGCEDTAKETAQAELAPTQVATHEPANSPVAETPRTQMISALDM